MTGDGCRAYTGRSTVAYPELVSGGFPSDTFKGLVKVSASNGVIKVDWKQSWPGGGFPGNQKTPLDTPLGLCKQEAFNSETCTYCRFMNRCEIFLSEGKACVRTVVYRRGTKTRKCTITVLITKRSI